MLSLFSGYKISFDLLESKWREGSILMWSSPCVTTGTA